MLNIIGELASGIQRYYMHHDIHPPSPRLRFPSLRWRRRGMSERRGFL